MSYIVATAAYQGPLDVLLELIEKQKLDICELALGEVTQSFLDYLAQQPL